MIKNNQKHHTHTLYVTHDQAGAAIYHPIILLLLTVWAINDHILKDIFANELTGKLSDITSLAVFPLLPYCSYELIWSLCGWKMSHHRHILLFWICATGLVMTGINLWDSWAHMYRIGLGCAQWPFYCLIAWINHDPYPGIVPVQLTMDASDLFTLPALYIPWWVLNIYQNKNPT
jgi:hypothetical protein